MRIVAHLIISLLATAFVSAQVAAPLNVVNSGIAATNDLGKQLILGKYDQALERMNPLWRKRLAQKVGGDDKLKERFATLPAELAKMRTSLIGFQTFGFPTVFEVAPGKKMAVVDGKNVEVMDHKKWLMLIPTVSRYRIIGDDGAHVVETRAFQVVISDKEKLDWSFIDGKSVSVVDLRALFITLPQNMKLPECSEKRVEQ